MKHAGPGALDRLEPFLEQLRAIEALKEKSRGAFYCKGRALLHFHEDGDALFADVRLTDVFERFEVTQLGQRAALLKNIKVALSSLRAAAPIRNRKPQTRKAGQSRKHG